MTRTWLLLRGLLREALGDDGRDGLDPPWDGRGPMPSGRTVRRLVLLPDGTRGLAYRQRTDGLYDVHLYRGGWPSVSLHPSEFRFVDRFDPSARVPTDDDGGN